MEATTTTEPDALREGLHAMWDAVAGGWEAHAGSIDARSGAMTARLLELSGPAPGERVLELACGPGGPGFAAAELVGPDGEVVVSDVSPQMTAIAGRRAAALRLGNVRARVLDLERIDEPDGAFDVVLCREGLMLVVDPERAASEIRRVLRPGGRVALSVWGPRAQNPWLGRVFDVVSDQLGAPLPPPGLPQPFSLDDAQRLAAVLRAGGLVDVEVSDLPVPYVAGSPDEWWERTVALAGPLSKVVAGLSADAARALRNRAVAAVAPYQTPDGLHIPGVSLIGSARRAG